MCTMFVLILNNHVMINSGGKKNILKLQIALSVFVYLCFHKRLACVLVSLCAGAGSKQCKYSPNQKFKTTWQMAKYNMFHGWILTRFQLCFQHATRKMGVRQNISLSMQFTKTTLKLKQAVFQLIKVFGPHAFKWPTLCKNKDFLPCFCQVVTLSWRSDGKGKTFSVFECDWVVELHKQGLWQRAIAAEVGRSIN